ncbi:hypothetical protein BESB_036060 [Besnoitia besnoiti]|uniref:Uncharacterized protein n=1 Tax=Besnoitia besnoiti TaxID=94643 RepID=A0A2A9MF50_BESBE|nr:hypothetical protein BESB_036060 [Besnoitia besnoiti]PFH37148.1 hypothetical protein BESB_036060 [Besnoitia besnoiti]
MVLKIAEKRAEGNCRIWGHSDRSLRPGSDGGHQLPPRSYKGVETRWSLRALYFRSKRRIPYVPCAQTAENLYGTFEDPPRCERGVYLWFEEYREFQGYA